MPRRIQTAIVLYDDRRKAWLLQWSEPADGPHAAVREQELETVGRAHGERARVEAAKLLGVSLPTITY